MTRLTSQIVNTIPGALPSYDQELIRKTGGGLREIACRAAGCREEDLVRLLGRSLVGVVPLTSGKGIIGGFCGAVRGIVEHLGAPSFVTAAADASGLAEAIERGAEVIFLADDERFIALDLPSRAVVDNSEATARGFVAALDLMVKGLKGRKVLVLGAGRVGRHALEALREYEASSGVYDPDPEKIRRLDPRCDGTVEPNLERALGKYSLLVEATPARSIIRAKHIRPDTFVAACGVPLGLSPGAVELIGDRLIHDPLQIGVAAMLTMALSKRKGMECGG